MRASLEDVASSFSKYFESSEKFIGSGLIIAICGIFITMEEIAKEIEICEKSLQHFSLDNKFAAGIARAVQKIKDKLNSKAQIDASTLRHDLRNSLGAALGYADLLRTKVKNNEEKIQVENINKSLKNILEEINS